MTAQDHLSGLQFVHSETREGHELDAYHQRKHVGTIAWSKGATTTDTGQPEQPGAIGLVMTHPARRREGIATSLLHEASRYTPQPVHSHVMSESGEAWASKVAGHPVTVTDHFHLSDRSWQFVEKPDLPS